MKAAYDINGQSVSAQAFYALACDPRRSVAVEACAGAGKTWMLVSRMVRALLEGVPAHEILAITLTKRAAAEMRERLYHQQRMTRLARVLLREYAALKRERGWIDMNDVERAALTLLGDPVLSGWVQERLIEIEECA